MEKDFFEFMNKEVQRLNAENRHSAKRIWRSALYSFCLSTGLEKLPLKELTVLHLLAYQQWLIDTKKSHNTIGCYMRALCTAYNRMTLGTPCHIYGLFASVYTGSSSQVKRAVLPSTMGKLLRAERKEQLEHLNQPLSWFVLMFLLQGIPFTDLAHLRKTDLQGERIVYRRRKTGRELSVGVPREAMEIIRRYAQECKGSPYLLPILKGEAKGEAAHERRYQNELRRFNHHLERLTILLRTGVRLSSYTARHTWATIAYHSNTPVGVISKALGHSSIKVTEFYLKPFADKEIDRTNRKVISVVKRSLGAE